MANQADDDLNNLADAASNQVQNAVAKVAGTIQNVSSSGVATGSAASPGPSGTGTGGSDKPGKRLYNPLSKLASYTYQLSLYMITPDAYAAFVASGRQKIDVLATGAPPSTSSSVGAGAYLIAQSGGINNSSTRRAPGFELDYYIDNLRFKTLIGTKATGTDTSAVADFSFQITEPYGFSFLTNLKRAADSLKAYTDSTSYKNLSNDFKQIYILGIRFYGYDINGNLITSKDSLYGQPIDPAGSGALFENFYDMQFTNVKFRLDGKTVVYTVDATGINAQALLGTKRGRMPTGLKVQGATVNDALQGPDGLFTKLNKTELEKTTKDPASATYPNKYNVIYQGDAATRIGLASMVTKSDLDKWRWPGSGAKNTSESTDAQGTKPPDPNERLFTFNNDTSIIQAIEQIIKKSSYMEQALSTVYSNAKQPDPNQKNNPQVKRDNPVPIAWFTVSTEIVGVTWDPKIQDWAFEQNFIISVYDIPSVATPYAPDKTRYYGPHKRYDYYFTGQNSEVLDYQLTFNNLYFNTVLGIENKDFKQIGTGQNPGAGRETEQTGSNSNSGSATGNTQNTAGNTGQKPDAPPPGSKDNSAGTATAGGASVTPGVRSNSNRTGSLAVGLEVQNSIVTSLHDVETYANGSIKILGDPDFLVRDSSTSITSLYSKFYDTDGYTISAQGGQVFIEVAFKEAVDYKNSTGLMEINENIFFLNYPQYIKDMAQGAVIWEVSEVDSVFASGKFEQTLKLIGTQFDTGEPTDTGTEGNTRGQGSNKTPQGTVGSKNGQTQDDDLETDLGTTDFDTELFGDGRT